MRTPPRFVLHDHPIPSLSRLSLVVLFGFAFLMPPAVVHAGAPVGAPGDFCGGPAAVDPAGATPIWRQNLTCNAADQHYAGIEYCTAENGKLTVAVIDLLATGVRAEYIIAHGIDGACKDPATCTPAACRDVNRSTKGLKGPGCDDSANRAYYPVMTLATAVKYAKAVDPHTALLIDSDYGAGTQGVASGSRDHGPEGLTVIQAKRIDGPGVGDFDYAGTDPLQNNAVKRPALSLSKDAPLRAEIGQLESDDGSRADWIYTAVGGGPWMIRGGEVLSTSIVNCENIAPSSCRKEADQTAVGLSAGPRYLFLVVDQRDGTLQALADFMHDKLAVTCAMKFDGGGSSQLWYADNVKIKGDGRQLSQYLAIVAPAGKGIDDIPPVVAPPETTPPASGFFDRIWKSVRDAVGQWIQQQWQRLMASLRAQAERAIGDWLQQNCGVTLMVPAVLALWVGRRRRR